MVGTMLNLVNEVLQSAVGNHFRNTLQDLPAVKFIETRQQVQELGLPGTSASTWPPTTWRPAASTSRTSCSPQELVEVLTQREIANQETHHLRRAAEGRRRPASRSRRPAAPPTCRPSSPPRRCRWRSARTRRGPARPTATGEAAFVRLTGQAEADRTQALGLAEARAAEALGLAKAAGYEAQRVAIGEGATAMVAVAGAVAEGHIDIVPDVLVTGGGGALDGLAATLMQSLRGNGSANGNGAALTPTPAPAPEPAQVPAAVAAAEGPPPGDDEG